MDNLDGHTYVLYRHLLDVVRRVLSCGPDHSLPLNDLFQSVCRHTSRCFTPSDMVRALESGVDPSIIYSHTGDPSISFYLPWKVTAPPCNHPSCVISRLHLR